MLAAAASFGGLKFRDVFTENSHSQPPAETTTSESTEQQSIPDSFDKSKYSLSEPGSPWWVVNKSHPLDPLGYAPKDLVVPDVRLRVPGNESMQLSKEPAAMVEEMFDDASIAGFDLMFSSGYRSYSYQVSLYGGYVKSMGQSEADKQSARPGYSEHQTGLAFDICNATDCDLVQSFGNSDMGKWVTENAHKYGFILRYPRGKQDITGYMYEPWHLRYIGKELAKEMHDKKIQTLEEFFSLPAAPDYL